MSVNAWMVSFPVQPLTERQIAQLLRFQVAVREAAPGVLFLPVHKV